LHVILNFLGIIYPTWVERKDNGSNAGPFARRILAASRDSGSSSSAIRHRGGSSWTPDRACPPPHFAARPDPRIDGTKGHARPDILVIAPCATIAGADTSGEVQKFGEAKLEWLGGFLIVSSSS
jgi:hypothetical protein